MASGTWEACQRCPKYVAGMRSMKPIRMHTHFILELVYVHCTLYIVHAHLTLFTPLWNIYIGFVFASSPIVSTCWTASAPWLRCSSKTIKYLSLARVCVFKEEYFVPIQRSENVQYRQCNTCQYFYASHFMHVCGSPEWLNGSGMAVDNRIILPSE